MVTSRKTTVHLPIRLSFRFKKIKKYKQLSKQTLFKGKKALNRLASKRFEYITTLGPIETKKGAALTVFKESSLQWDVPIWDEEINEFKPSQTSFFGQKLYANLFRINKDVTTLDD